MSEHEHPALVETVRLQLELLHWPDSPGRPGPSYVGSPRSTAWRWLGDHPDDAAELAALLNEAAPGLGLRSGYTSQRRSHTLIPAVATLSRQRDLGLDEDLLRLCVQEAHPIPAGPDLIPWDALVACLPSDAVLAKSETTTTESSGLRSSAPSTPRRASTLDVNSGGAVFFCLFEGAARGPGSTSPRKGFQEATSKEQPSAAAIISAAANALAEAASAVASLREEENITIKENAVEQTKQLAENGCCGVVEEERQPSSHMDSRSLHKQTVEFPSIPTARRSQSESVLSQESSYNLVDPPVLPPTYGCLILKVPPTRLQCQSELFASEITRHVGVACPEARILRQFTYEEDETATPEWGAMLLAAERVAGACPELLNELQRSGCVLLQEYIPRLDGKEPVRCTEETCSDLGRMFALDMLLGNADRLVCEPLGWRGNAGNVLQANRGRWKGRIVAIDALVQRRPPNGLVSAEDASCERWTELILNDTDVAGSILKEILTYLGIPGAPPSWNRLHTLGAGHTRPLQAGCKDAADGSQTCCLDEADIGLIVDFQQGFRHALQSMSELKGLFEMMYGVVGTWIDEFLADMEANFLFSAATPHGNRATTSQKAWQSPPPFSQPSPDIEVSTVGFASPPGMHQKREAACVPLPGLICCSPPPQAMVPHLQRTPPGSRRVSEHGLGTPGLSSHGDASSSGAADVVATTQRIRHINQEAQTDDRVSRRVSRWRDVFRARGRELRGAVAAWQAKRGVCGGGLEDTEKAHGECKDSREKVGISSFASAVDVVSSPSVDPAHKLNERSSNPPLPRPSAANIPSPSATTHMPLSVNKNHPALLTTGFLDGARPVVDVYELRVRLQHMLPRLRVLQVAAASARPLCLLPGVYLSDAVGASSMHTLRHLGITHILNATDDLLGPDPSLQATWIRCALRDVEEEDISPFFEVATRFIDDALNTGGRVLVHCHAGRSRSCSLILAWMMESLGWSLRKGLHHIHRLRPEVAPNAGYMARLLRLEEQLFGQQTVKGRKPKPRLRTCPDCGKKVGLSKESVRIHMRRFHPRSIVHEPLILSQVVHPESSSSSSEFVFSSIKNRLT